MRSGSTTRAALTRRETQAALKSFEAATKADGNFALAFSVAKSYSTLGYDTKPARPRSVP